MPAPELTPWLMLLHNIPPKPAYLRVKIWRRLQALGAVAVKNAAYVLPRSEQAHEDLRWVCREIEQGGGDAVLCEARFMHGLDDAGLRGLFDAARDADYAAVAEEARRIGEELAEQPAEMETAVRKLRRRFDQVAVLDFFGAAGREPAEGALSGLEARLKPASERQSQARAETTRPSGRVWVTRAQVFVDRIASAWLIKRFIDPRARFKFVSEKEYSPKAGELRFDMFDAEFTHEGDNCTFEVLQQRFAGDDPGLRQLAEIVHDIDLKDGKFARAEAAGVLQLVSGICESAADDVERVKRGSELFEALYRSFRGKRG